MISALEYAYANYGSTATLHSLLPEMKFTPASAWYDADEASCREAMASRILLRSESPLPPFVSNVVAQYFTISSIEPIRLAEIDTSLDITALPEALVLSHSTDLDGYLCVDEGSYVASNLDLHLRRSQLAYRTPSGQSALAILTATATSEMWGLIETELQELEQQWLSATIRPVIP